MLNTAIGGTNPTGIFDRVTGNSGADQFVVGNNCASTIITDFEVGIDKIIGNKKNCQ